MTSRTSLCTIAAAALLLTTSACDKLGLGGAKEEAAVASAQEAPAPPPVPAQDVATLKDGEVASYPSMTPASGTRVLNQGFTVYQAADRSSKVLGNLSSGTWVNLKGSLANWLLVDWPSGVGQLSPGWIEATVNDRRIPTAPDAGIGGLDAGFVPQPIDAGTVPPVVDAGPAPAADGGRPRLRIPVTN